MPTPPKSNLHLLEDEDEQIALTLVELNRLKRILGQRKMARETQADRPEGCVLQNNAKLCQALFSVREILRRTSDKVENINKLPKKKTKRPVGKLIRTK